MIFPQAFNPKLSQYALTPFGRTAPLDVAGRKVLGITDLTASTAIYVNITAWMTAAGFVLFLVLAVSEFFGLVDMSGFGSAAEPFKWAVVLAALFFYMLGPYASLMWQIRRLHDLGQSGGYVLVPVAFWIGRPLAIAAAIGLMLGLDFVMDELAAGVPSLMRSAVGLFCGLATVAMYEGFVFARHKRAWYRDVITAPGQAGMNRFGPAPN